MDCTGGSRWSHPHSRNPPPQCELQQPHGSIIFQNPCLLVHEVLGDIQTEPITALGHPPIQHGWAFSKNGLKRKSCTLELPAHPSGLKERHGSAGGLLDWCQHPCVLSDIPCIGRCRGRWSQCGPSKVEGDKWLTWVHCSVLELKVLRNAVWTWNPEYQCWNNWERFRLDTASGDITGFMLNIVPIKRNILALSKCSGMNVNVCNLLDVQMFI